MNSAPECQVFRTWRKNEVDLVFQIQIWAAGVHRSWGCARTGEEEEGADGVGDGGAGSVLAGSGGGVDGEERGAGASGSRSGEVPAGGGAEGAGWRRTPAAGRSFSGGGARWPATGSKGGAGRRALGLSRGWLAAANGPAQGSAGLGGRGREGGGTGDDVAAAGSTGAEAR
nr:uncharacterized PE-PGRS family protein PE_PGRS54-like [Aegilops tauschii subsp. strangulata]